MQEIIRENEEKELRVLRKNEERVDQLRRENKQLEEEQRRKNEERLAFLLLENETQLANLVAKQEEEEEKKKEESVSRKRKADKLEANKQPAAPECPVCLLEFQLFVCLFVVQLLSQVCLDEMVPPTKIFHCVNGHHICETCK